ncbi:threonine-phosphate decarboxylase CobD [Clostridium sp.]|uniref:threonine-phosphate decarboxylase CobD n=1 Tax=Clostridium sp. TaxID=1506 RepID=UPI003F3D7476
MNLGHGGNVEEISRIYKINEKDIIDFSANINPLGINSNVKSEMIKALDKIERYPDITYYELKSEIANYEGVKRENIILGNGAAEVIFNITRGLNPKKALIPAPTFSEYEDALNAVNCSVVHYEMNEDFNLDNGFIDKIKEDIDIIFICNPNNPTGVLTSKKYLEEVLKKARTCNAKVVVDESFVDFISEREEVSLINLINKYENLIVVKSLTKFFAFPGIRVGYGILKNKDYINKINKISVPWSINTVAVYGAIEALKQKEYISKSIENIKIESEFLYLNLSSFNNLKVYKGEVNFIFFKVIKDIDLKEELLKYGLLIRSCNNYKGLEKGYYRVAVRTRSENLSLINALKNILN